MNAMASQITGVLIVYSTFCSGIDQRKYQSFAPLVFVGGGGGGGGGQSTGDRGSTSNTENVSIGWRHHNLMTTPFAVTCEFPSQSLVTRSFDAFFDLRLNKRLSKQ